MDTKESPNKALKQAPNQTLNSQENYKALIEKLHALTLSPGAEFTRVVEQLQCIPGLPEAIVSRANSPEFALRKQVTRVQHAIAVLGLHRTAETIARFDVGRTNAGVRRPHMQSKKSGAKTAARTTS